MMTEESRILRPDLAGMAPRPAMGIQIQVPPQKMPVIYLAGAIRDNYPEDIEWRERLLKSLQNLAVFLNPLGGKTQDPTTKQWSVSGVPSSARFITQHDRWSVRRSDIVVFNFRALSQKYPNIGTLVEFGMAVMNNCLIYSIVDPEYKGHENERMYHLHPFLEEFSAHVFATVDDCEAFLKNHLPVLSGVDPHYKG